MVKWTRLSPQTFLKSLGVLKILIFDEVTKSRKRNYRNTHFSLEITRPRKELHFIAYYLDCRRVSLSIVHNYGPCFFTVSIRVCGRIQQNKIIFIIFVLRFLSLVIFPKLYLQQCCLLASLNFISSDPGSPNTVKTTTTTTGLFPFRLLPNTICHG